MINKIILLLLLSSLFLGIYGCATIGGGLESNYLVTSNPPGAEIYQRRLNATKGNGFFDGITPKYTWNFSFEPVRIRVIWPPEGIASDWRIPSDSGHLHFEKSDFVKKK